MVGQREAVAMPVMVFRQTCLSHAVDDFRLDRDEMLGMELMGHAKQYRGFMRSLAGFGKRRPSRVVRSQIESRLVGFIIEPGLHVAGVAQFGERLAESNFRVPPWWLAHR